ncbi:Stabilin-2 [Mactra antiquata]
MIIKYGYIYMCVLMSVTIVTCDNKGKCDYREIKTLSETSCTNCKINDFVKCPQNTTQLTSLEGIKGCHYELYLSDVLTVPMIGCSHACEKTQQVYDCCHGYWGPQCDECPGGHETPCNGHGQCNETIKGTGLCQCDAGWSGYACEFCIDPDIGGDQCKTDSIDSVADICKNFTCPNNSECVSIDNEAICSCKWPYIEHDETVANSTKDIVCEEIDRCKLPPYCDGNATCEESTQTDSIDKTCTCNHGYNGDGYICVPIDPCQSNNGGCDVTTSTCLYLEPGKSKCECKNGYEFSNTSTGSCELINSCITQNITCDGKATCITLSPDETICQCPDGYEGDGQNCYGNIVQTIKDLNAHDPILEGQFTFILKALQKYYYTELTEHASFTMFVPVDEGFRTVDNPDFQAWLNDEVRVKQIIRQHIIVGEFKADNLTDADFVTLQGTSAVLNTNRRNEFRFRLRGDNRKGKILKMDIIATNGMIHVIDKLLVNDPNTLLHRQKTVYENLINIHSMLKIFIDSLGTEIKDILINDNVTLFAPSNRYFILPAEAEDYIKSPQGQEKLKILVLNHIFAGRVEITDLLNKGTITSLANITNEISVIPGGRIKLNGHSSILQADMTTSNGYIQDLNGLLITSTMSVYPDRCENDTSGQGPGCCAGFFGPDCQMCPGGWTNPCNGHGTCDDGISGTGECSCYPQFTGVSCGDCIKNRWGPNCTQDVIEVLGEKKMCNFEEIMR